MTSSSSLQAKIGMVLVLAGVSVLAGSSSNNGGRRAESRIGGQSRWTVSPMDGETCPVPQATAGETMSIPVNPITVALVMQEAASARRAAGPTAAPEGRSGESKASAEDS